MTSLPRAARGSGTVQAAAPDAHRTEELQARRGQQPGTGRALESVEGRSDHPSLATQLSTEDRTLRTSDLVGEQARVPARDLQDPLEQSGTVLECVGPVQEAVQRPARAAPGGIERLRLAGFRAADQNLR